MCELALGEDIPESNLLSTLVIALGAAGFGALAAAWLRQPVVVGYIVAGLVIGPNTPGIEASVPGVEQLADLGVILLLFVIGVQLSLADLVKVGPVALVGGSAQVLLTIGLGWAVGVALGWGHLESLFFGAVLSNSSSTVLTKVLGERGEESTLHGRLALAWSTVQDFSTVILVVVLTTFAEGERDQLVMDVAEAVLLAAAYLVLVIPLGAFLLPRFFDWLASLGSSEVFVLGAAGVALGIAYLASVFGISVALGAFVGGMLVARSDISHEVLGQITPLRDLFSGMFFVSVGMLIDPELVLENFHLVGLGVLLIVLAKGAMVTAGVRMFGYRPGTAILSGVILGQSAEFSFLMARVGAQVDAVSPEVFGLMLTSAAASIVLAPYLLRAAQPFAIAADQRFSARADTATSEPPVDQSVRDHAIICGYGRVGRVVHRALVRSRVSCVVIDQDGGLIRELRNEGVTALQGNAANATLLERAGISRAWTLVIATPDPLATRQILTIARRHNPRIGIMVRTHSAAERLFLESQGANEAVVGELELGFELTRHAMRRFGIAAPIVERVLQELRVEEGGRAPEETRF